MTKLPCGHEDYGVECLVCVSYGSLNPNNKSMSELEQVAHLVTGTHQPINAETADKLARACLAMMQALKAILATENQDYWNPHKLLVAFRHNEHEARDALSKVDEIMKETNEGYVCNHCGVPTGNYQLCDKCAFKILEKIKMKGSG